MTEHSPLSVELRELLRIPTTATLTGTLAKHGIRHAFMVGVRPLAPNTRMVGQAFTLRYIPAREDLDHTGALDNLTDPQRVAIERVGPNEVFVIDARGDVRAGTMGAADVVGRSKLPRSAKIGAACSVLPVGIGMSARNAAAVLEGLLSSGGHFHRTPKRGGGSLRSDRRPRVPVAEIVLTAFFLVAVGCFVAARQWISIPFLLLFLSGFACVTTLALRERVVWSRQRFGGMASIT